MKSWQLQQAKAHFSQVVKEAIANGPQEISLHGKPAVMLISISEYERLTKPKQSFIEFLRQSPLVGINILIKRNKSQTRKVDL